MCSAPALLLALSSIVSAAEPAATQAAPPALDAKSAFEQLKTLAGEWQGTAGHGDGKEIPATVTYRIASGGTVVMETLFPGTPHEMISMYHLNGPKLVVSHFCAMGNQPRMTLAPRSSASELRFDFDGGENLNPAKDTHIHAGVLRPSDDELLADSTTWKDGKEAGHNRFTLQRNSAARP
jgi:hypothetical protein